jgi:hypothetical protein
VRHLAPNTYEFQSLIDQESRILELPEEAFSPFPYSLATPNPLYSYSSLKILGGGNGFTPEQPCTGFLIEHQGIVYSLMPDPISANSCAITDSTSLKFTPSTSLIFMTTIALA